MSARASSFTGVALAQLHAQARVGLHDSSTAQSRTLNRSTIRLDTPSALLFRPPFRQMPLPLLLGPRHRLVTTRRKDPGVEQLFVPQHSRLHPNRHKAATQETSFSSLVRFQSVCGEGSEGNTTYPCLPAHENQLAGIRRSKRTTIKIRIPLLNDEPRSEEQMFHLELEGVSHRNGCTMRCTAPLGSLT